MPVRYRNEVLFQDGLRLCKSLGCKVMTANNRFTNGEFIAMIADDLALAQRPAQDRKIKWFSGSLCLPGQ